VATAAEHCLIFCRVESNSRPLAAFFFGSQMCRLPMSAAVKLFAPDFVLRYIVTHEMVHLAVRDHSRKFWLPGPFALSLHRRRVPSATTRTTRL
jgi:hypothetical protein